MGWIHSSEMTRTYYHFSDIAKLRIDAFFKNK